MLAKSHMLLGLLGGAAISYTPVYGAISRLMASKSGALLNPELLAQGETFYFGALLPLVVVGSVFPDIDEPRSFIGRKLPLISRIVSLSFSHRGFTHFFIFPLLIVALGVLVAFYNHIFGLCFFAFAFGIFMHQIGDMLTKSGIPYYFFPFSKMRAVLLPSALRFKTGSLREKSLVYAVFIPLLALFGMDKFNLYDSFEIEQILKLIGEIA